MASELNFFSESMEDYFTKVVNIVNMFRPEEDKLNSAEKKFFVYFCILCNSGVDMDSYESLFNGFRDVIGTDYKKSTISQYKSRISAKRWIRGGRNELRIPSDFILDEGRGDFKLNLFYEKD